jgi:hypothetical protein
MVEKTMAFFFKRQRNPDLDGDGCPKMRNMILCMGFGYRPLALKRTQHVAIFTGGFMKYWVGKSMVVIGILHTFLGSARFHGILDQMLKEGLFNTVRRQPDRFGAFWFLFAGLAVILFGVLIDWIEKKRLAFPAFLKWGFLVITALGCLIVPKSGFWLMVVPTVGLWMAKSEK